MTKRFRIVRDRQWLACITGALILGGVAADRAFLHAASRDAEDYHARVARAVDKVPAYVGNWVSSEAQPLTKGAVAMLRPNITMSRRFLNLNTREEASLLLVQCRDARDLVGHYPPVCYKANGWTLSSASASDWKLEDGLVLHGMVYEFECMRVSGKQSMKVYDVMILPDGQTAADMDGVYLIARNRNMRHFGAAQIQIMTSAGMPEEERKNVISTILGATRPVIDAIREGVTP